VEKCAVIRSHELRTVMTCIERKEPVVVLAPHKGGSRTFRRHLQAHLSDCHPDAVSPLPQVCALTGHTGTVTSVNFRPDGRILASGARDNTVRLWEVASLVGCAVRTAHLDDSAH
jgi:WD40 repeat protein